MFFVLSKIIYWLVMPTSLIVWVAISSIFVKRNKQRRVMRLLALSLLLFFTNPFIATVAINTWEPKATPYAEIETYHYGVVLSGITNPNRPPLDRIQFNKGADRIVHAMDLYKKGLIRKILITGGSGTLTFEGNKESHALKEFALDNGVPASDLLIEDRARNTRENALYTSEMLPNTSDEVVLITSAFHMYRARKCFEKTGLSVAPFATDHYGREMRYTPDDLIIPSLYGLKVWTILTKEWIGISAYKVAGYI